MAVHVATFDVNSLFIYVYLAVNAVFVPRWFFYIVNSEALVFCGIYYLRVLVTTVIISLCLCMAFVSNFPAGAFPYGAQPPRRSDAGIQGAEPPILTA